jgi:hypothetical protein
MRLLLLCDRGASCPASGNWLAFRNFHAILQLVESVDDNRFARADAGYSRNVSVRRSNVYVSRMYRSVRVYDIQEGKVIVALDGRGGNQIHVIQRFHEQLRVYKFLREKLGSI